MIKIEDVTETTTKSFVTITLDKEDAIRLMHVCGRISGYREHPIRLLTKQIYQHIYHKFVQDYNALEMNERDALVGILRLERP